MRQVRQNGSKLPCYQGQHFMLTQLCCLIPQECLGFLRVCHLLPAASTLLPGERPVQATWHLEMGRYEQSFQASTEGSAECSVSVCVPLLWAKITSVSDTSAPLLLNLC
jgi:hypothetical protein